MAQDETGNGPTTIQGAAGTPQPTQQQLIVNAQYIKDLSFENPRAPQSLTQPPGQPAVDINVDVNPLGARPHQDPRLVAIMEKHGFVWGGRWLRPDGAHFEYVGSG